MREKLFGKEWIFEDFLPNERVSSLEGFLVEREIFTIKTSYQKLSIIENEGYGRMLFLNDLVQLAEKGEEVYHEMLVHPALLLHENPKRVMIIGGGDGGALREVLQHPAQEVLLVEIDKDVIEISKKYLPSVSQGAFDDARVTVMNEDGAKVLSQYKDYFDCIILDSNDPDGEMATGLFTEDFFVFVLRALRKEGVFAAQTGYFSDPHRRGAQMMLRNIFPVTWMHRALVRYYPIDEHSFSFGAAGKKYEKVTLSKLQARFQKRGLQTSYYSPEMHFASSVVPPYLKRERDADAKSGKR